MNIFIRLSFACLISVAQTVCAGMDDQALKEYLSRNFTADESMPWEKRSEFKTSRGVTDEQLRRVLMEIYNEASAKKASLTPKTREWHDNRRTIEGVLGWLPICEDTPVKDFLIDYAVSQENDYLTRSDAVLSYLRLADAEESKNILLRFLVEENRMDDKSRIIIYGHARTTYDVASPEKKASVLAALLAAASREEGKIEFMKVDNILAERSSTYRYSLERLAMLERHSLAPPTTNLYTDRDLKAALEECRKYKTPTSVNTNLAALKARNFNLPLPAGQTNEVMSTEDDNAVVEEKTANSARRNVRAYALFGVTVLILLGFGAWKLTKK